MSRKIRRAYVIRERFDGLARAQVPNNDESVMAGAEEDAAVAGIALQNKHFIRVLLQRESTHTPVTILNWRQLEIRSTKPIDIPTRTYCQ